MAAHGKSPFLQLPSELHLEIFRFLMCEANSPKLYCKTLRQVHPRLAHFEEVNMFLFSTIVLRPSSDCLADTSGFTTIKSYVELIDVEPVAMGTRAKLAQVVAFFDMLPKPPTVIIRDVPFSRPDSMIMPQATTIIPKALLLADLMAQSLAGSKSQIHGLDLRYYEDLFVDLTEQESWKNLDLGSLRALHFAPSFSYCYYPWRRRHGIVRRRPEEIVAAVTGFISRVADHLETLSANGGTALECFNQTGSMPAMPSLRNLTLHNICLDQPRFIFWLNNRAPSLESVTFVELTGREGFYNSNISHWRPLFSAIAHHPNRLAVTFKRLAFKPSRPEYRSNGFLDLQHHTSQKAEDTGHLHKLDRCMTRTNICASIKNYMSGFGDWISEEEENKLYGPQVCVSDVQGLCCVLESKKSRQRRNQLDFGLFD